MSRYGGVCSHTVQSKTDLWRHYTRFSLSSLVFLISVILLQFDVILRLGMGQSAATVPQLKYPTHDGNKNTTNDTKII
jgi:hypothetical protein